jgi:hypothetical protein
MATAKTLPGVRHAYPDSYKQMLINGKRIDAASGQRFATRNHWSRAQWHAQFPEFANLWLQGAQLPVRVSNPWPGASGALRPGYVGQYQLAKLAGGNPQHIHYRAAGVGA